MTVDGCSSHSSTPPTPAAGFKQVRGERDIGDCLEKKDPREGKEKKTSPIRGHDA